jgi:hypothetical protein
MGKLKLILPRSCITATLAIGRRREDMKKIVKSVKTWGLQCDEVVGDERDYINISTCGYNMSSWQVDLPPI